jgi:hypothetical protein
LAGKDCQVYKLIKHDIYRQSDWESSQQLRYSRAKATKQQYDYRADPINYLFEIAAMFESYARDSRDLLKKAEKGEKLDDYGEGWTYETAQAIAEQWEAAEKAIQPAVDFAIERRLTAPINQAEYLAQDQANMVAMLKAALNITKCEYLDNLQHGQLKNIFQSVIDAIEQAAIPLVATDKEETPPEPEEEGKPKNDTPGRSRKKPVTPSSPTPESLSEPENIPLQTAEDLQLVS